MNAFLKYCIGTALRPTEAFESLARGGRVGPAVCVVVAAGLVYGMFVLWMYLAGHQPSFTGNPIPAEQYYLWQAAFLAPWLLVVWVAFASTAHGLARALGSTAGWRATAAPLGFVLAVPLVLGYLLPEMVAFGLFGHDALVAAMRITGPVTLLWWGALGSLALRSVHERSWVASIGVALASLVVMIVVTAVLVR